MADDNLKITVHQAVNGYIAKVNDQATHVFLDTMTLVEWFEKELNSRFGDSLTASKKDRP